MRLDHLLSKEIGVLPKGKISYLFTVLRADSKNLWKHIRVFTTVKISYLFTVLRAESYGPVEHIGVFATGKNRRKKSSLFYGIGLSLLLFSFESPRRFVFDKVSHMDFQDVRASVCTIS